MRILSKLTKQFSESFGFHIVMVENDIQNGLRESVIGVSVTLFGTLHECHVTWYGCQFIFNCFDFWQLCYFSLADLANFSHFDHVYNH